MDPIAFRMKNMIREGETSPIFAIMGEGTEGTPMTMSSCKLPYCVERGMELIDWKNKYPRVISGKDKVRGVGMAIAMQGSGIPLIDMASATLKLNDGGFYNLTVGATDIGQKSDTILGQIAAEELQTTPDKIVVTSSDTDLTPFDTGAYASSTTYVSGNAVLKAAKAMKRALFREASLALDISEDQLRFDGSCFRGPGKEISLEMLSNRLYYNADQKQISVTESYVGHQSPLRLWPASRKSRSIGKTGKRGSFDTLPSPTAEPPSIPLRPAVKLKARSFKESEWRCTKTFWCLLRENF
jgi:CO/xanthine dehydrogenase Mo-binding subunit